MHESDREKMTAIILCALPYFVTFSTYNDSCALRFFYHKINNFVQWNDIVSIVTGVLLPYFSAWVQTRANKIQTNDGKTRGPLIFIYFARGCFCFQIMNRSTRHEIQALQMEMIFLCDGVFAYLCFYSCKFKSVFFEASFLWMINDLHVLFFAFFPKRLCRGNVIVNVYPDYFISVPISRR